MLKVMSAWMTAAARQAALVRAGLQGVAAWESEHGELTAAELDAARRRLHRAARERPATVTEK